MTYKQLADELGVTKDKIKYHAKKVGREHLNIVDNVTYLNDDGIAIIKALVVGKKSGLSTGATPDIITHLENFATQQAKTNELLVTLIEQNEQQKLLPDPAKKKERKKFFDKNFITLLVISAIIIAFCIWAAINFG